MLSEKYIFTLVLSFSIFLAKAQVNDTIHRVDADNILVKTLNKNILSRYNKLITERKRLQKDFENASDTTLYNIKNRTENLKTAIVDLVKTEQNTLIIGSTIENKNVDSQLLLARLVYIKASLWCMQKSLSLRVDEIYINTSLDTDNENENKTAFKIVNLTSSTMINLENASRFDRMKFRHNDEGVVSNWKNTANNLKTLRSKTQIKDNEYDILYKNVLTDLDSMINVLCLFSNNTERDSY